MTTSCARPTETTITEDGKTIVSMIVWERGRLLRNGDTLVTKKPEGVLSFTKPHKFLNDGAVFEVNAPLAALWIKRIE